MIRRETKASDVFTTISEMIIIELDYISRICICLSFCSSNSFENSKMLMRKQSRQAHKIEQDQ